MRKKKSPEEILNEYYQQVAGDLPISQEVVDYKYRELFHLSFEDFMNEPHEVYLRNLLIMQSIAKYEARSARANERLAKRGSQQ